MEIVLSIAVGLGLSAACGFRVFVPLLALSIAAHSAHLELAPSFQWVSSDAALIAFTVATALEIAGYYIPWVDHFLDTVASPAAVVAGTIVTAAMLSDVSPFLQWSLAIIAGGGVAGLVQGGTVVTRAVSTATTAGFGNFVIASLELGLSVLTSVLALLWPLLAASLAIGLCGVVGVVFWKRTKPRSPTTIPAPAPVPDLAPPTAS